MQLSIRSEGHSAPHNGTNGDLLVIVEAIEHKYLKRDGNNLFYSVVISAVDAMLGTTISVPTLDGYENLKIEAGTQSGTIVRLKGKGMPSLNGYGKGDQYVKILVWIPRKLSRTERETMEKMRSSSSFEPNLSREDKALFDKEKNIF